MTAKTQIFVTFTRQSYAFQNPDDHKTPSLEIVYKVLWFQSYMLMFHQLSTWEGKNRSKEAQNLNCRDEKDRIRFLMNGMWDVFWTNISYILVFSA